MSAALLRNGTRATALIRRRSFGESIGPPVTRPVNRYPNAYASLPKWSYYSSFSTNSSKFNVVGWYLGMVKSHPVFTKSVTSACIYTAADFSSQTIARPSSEPYYDLVRTARMAGYGMIILGPSLHFWFNFVSKVLPKRDIFTTLKKIVMGQTLYGPVMTVVFFSVNAALQGENVPEIVARLKRDLIPTLINGAMYWPICDFVTFKFIPVHLQPLVSNSFSYLWTVYMTYMAGLEKATPLNYKTDILIEAE